MLRVGIIIGTVILAPVALACTFHIMLLICMRPRKAKEELEHEDKK